eukprot:201144_1
MAQRKTQSNKIPTIAISLKNKIKLGSGSFAIVYLVSDKGKNYAVKVPHVKDLDIMKEIKVSSELTESLFITKFCGMCEIEKQIVFAFEACAMNVDQFYTIRDFNHKSSDEKTDDDHKSSHDIEKSDENVISEAREAFAIYVICCGEKGLKYMHSKDFCHRDIKPENMLMGIDGNIKLTDHGFSRSCEGIVKTACGTETFMAPEIAKNFSRRSKPYDGTSADQWSMGITLLSFFTDVYGTIAAEFDIDNDEFCKYPQMYSRICEIANKVKNKLKSPILKKCLLFTVKKDPKERYDASVCLENCFPKDYNFERIKSDCKFISERFITAKKNDPNVGIKGANCCICVNPFDVIKIDALMNSKDKSVRKEYRGGALCDICDVEINEGTIYHCNNRIFHGQPGNFDLCKRCAIKRNKTLKKNWIEGNAPIKNV